MPFDLIIIGGGPAGYHAAVLAGRAGLQTLLIEERAVGGVCLNEGCIPSKTWLHSAKIYQEALKGSIYGVQTERLSLDHAKVMARKNKVVKILTAGIKQKLQKYQVTLVEAAGKIAGRAESGFQVEAAGELYTGKRLLIATGSKPVVPPIPGLQAALENGYALTSTEIFNLATIPSSLVVIGGGAIGLEMASYFNAAGSKVTVVELQAQIGGAIDAELAGILQRNLEKQGVAFRLQAQVTAVRAGSVQVSAGEQAEELAAEKVLLSTGRRPSLDGLGLETIGLQPEEGRLRIDEYGRCTPDGVYAAGDVTGRSMLAHTAYREAEICIAHLLGRAETINYQAIPAVIYTDPELASVGETPASAAAKGLNFEVISTSMRYSGRYLAETEGGDGLCKLVISLPDRRLLGVHLLSRYASELIYGAGMMIEQGMTVDAVGKLVFPHPTVSEIIKEAAFQI